MVRKVYFVSLPSISLFPLFWKPVENSTQALRQESRQWHLVYGRFFFEGAECSLPQVACCTYGFILRTCFIMVYLSFDVVFNVCLPRLRHVVGKPILF